MSKPRIVFIGDYEKANTIELLTAFIEKYTVTYDILVSGYHLESVRQFMPETVEVAGMGSSIFVYFSNTAEYVLITTPAPRFIKCKSNQKLIYVLSEIDFDQFENCIGDIDQIITDERKTADIFTSKFEHIQIDLISNDKSNSILDAIKIDPEPVADKRNYLIIAEKGKTDYFRDQNGLHHYFDKIKRDPGNNIIFCSLSGMIEESTLNIPLDTTAKSMCIFGEHGDTILFETDTMRVFFEDFIEKHGIRLRTDKLMLLSDMQLKILEDAVEKHERIDFSKDASNYVKYRDFIERLYDINNCAQIKVSIILLRFNTPIEMLNRAIASALNCGHNNIELLLIDDGSEDNIEDQIKSSFRDERIKYFYKENEGPGLSRNYGLEKATGQFIFYLDSDDTMHPNGIRSLISHAVFFELDMVAGKRILCDEKGIPRSESLSYLAGDTFVCYYCDADENDAFADVMLTNKLIKKDFLVDEGISFNRGPYSDVAGTAPIYSRLSEYHYINVPVHDWYQYGNNSTVSTVVNIRNFEQRILKEEQAWIHCPERVRKNRMKTILLYDFNLFLNSYYDFTEEEQRSVFEKLSHFVVTKRDYLLLEGYWEKTRELARALTSGNIDYFRFVIERYYYPEKKQCAEYEDYVVVTHYQLFVACLNALKSKKRSRLYLCNYYAAFDTNLVYRVRQTDLFEVVKTFNDNTEKLFAELDKRPGEENIIIPQFLYGKYRDVFKECDPQKDVIHIFSDSLPYWYYVEREFKKIVKHEYEYDSFDYEDAGIMRRDIWARIVQYEGKTFPLMFNRSDRIGRIVVSKKPESIRESDVYKIDITDTRDLENEMHEKINGLMLKIYDMDSRLFSPDATLLITQPLSQYGYCSEKEQKELTKLICAPYKDSSLLIKSHPDDSINYKYLGGTVLPKNIPSVAYNYLDVRIARVISFESNAVELIDIAKEQKVYLNLHETDSLEVKSEIKKILDPNPAEKSFVDRKKIKKIINRAVSRQTKH